MRLCLHGKTITLTENACIKITKGELIITDCTGQGKIVFPKDGIAVEKKYQAGKLTTSEARSGGAPTEIPTGPASGS